MIRVLLGSGFKGVDAFSMLCLQGINSFFSVHEKKVYAMNDAGNWCTNVGCLP